MAAALAFVSLGYAPVTMLQTTTESSSSSYYAFTETLTPFRCCLTVNVTLPQATSILVPFVTNYTLTPIPYTLTSSFESWSTYLTTQTLTRHVPASAALGLTPRAFILLAVTVIGALALITGWLFLKLRTGRTRPRRPLRIHLLWLRHAKPKLGLHSTSDRVT